MTLQNPLGMGSTEHEPPDSSWEVGVNVELDPSLTTIQMREVQEAVWEALTTTLLKVVAPYHVGPDDLVVLTVRGRGEQTPLFPLVAGRLRFTCHQDVVEVVENACTVPDLREVAYDAWGRAYALGVHVGYVRDPQNDGRRRAVLPDPAQVTRTRRERAERTRGSVRTHPDEPVKQPDSWGDDG